MASQGVELLVYSSRLESLRLNCGRRSLFGAPAVRAHYGVEPINPTFMFPLVPPLLLATRELHPTHQSPMQVFAWERKNGTVYVFASKLC